MNARSGSDAWKNHTKRSTTGEAEAALLEVSFRRNPEATQGYRLQNGTDRTRQDDKRATIKAKLVQP
jgi:hypothetical protein